MCYSEPKDEGRASRRDDGTADADRTEKVLWPLLHTSDQTRLRKEERLQYLMSEIGEYGNNADVFLVT